jgi:hypothetical protein
LTQTKRAASISGQRVFFETNTSQARRDSELREAVGAPLVRTDAIVDYEEPVRIVFPLDFQKPRIVTAPMRLIAIDRRVDCVTFFCRREK